MKTQTKLLIILAVTTILLFAGFLVILNLQKKQTEILLRSATEQQESVFSTAINSKSDVIYSTLYDYTYWDDLIQYLNEPDPAWADDNLYTLFNSFHVNAVWMYNLEMKKAFESGRIDSTEVNPDEIPAEVFPVLYTNRFIRFYLSTSLGIFEVQGATMHQSNDEARRLPPRGYFFMAKLLDTTYLKTLEKLTGGQVRLTKGRYEPETGNEHTVVTDYPLENWDHRTIGQLVLSREYDFMNVFHRLSRTAAWFLAILIGIILTIFFIAFHLLVKKPLDTLSKALLTKSEWDRHGLHRLKSEFRTIGLLIDAYFEQQEALETEIEVRKKTEAQREKLIAELDTANRELKDFAYIVSHDLKAPLRAIGSISQWIHADYSDKLDEEGKTQLDLLLNRVHRMQNLIEGVLAYSRVTRVAEEKEDIDLNRLVPDAIDLVGIPASFRVHIDENLPTVRYGPTRLLQVFENLISNAVKYNNKPLGEISIRCRDNGSGWAISVLDNGPGIEEKYYQKIFQIFQTLQARDEFESTGIGLTIVKKIIESNGGFITVDSVPGSGTTFTFTIPK